MKFTHSPSISSSAPRESVLGRLSFVLQRILCSRTHPFDHLKEFDPIEDHTQNSMNSDFPATPNLVARLMGLDTMPGKNIEKGAPPITRSKSTSSMNRRIQETGEVQRTHRRMKSSNSLRETVPFFELEDDGFLVLRFDKPGRMKAVSEWRRRRRRRSKEVGRRHGIKIEEGGYGFAEFVHRMEKFDGKWKGEDESESENLSPVSILDHTLFVGDHESFTSAEEDTRSRSSSPSRRFASELSNLDHSLYDHNNGTCSKGDHDQEASESIEGRQSGLQRKDYHNHRNIEMLNQICRLTELEIAGSEWECKGGLVKNLKNWEVEIGVELGLQIVKQMVDEVVQQLLLEI